jgi:beta-phosphoglucomutase family hydrolase
VLGLPEQIRACLFDLDGVLTDTAAVHSAAWKEMFDQYLSERARQTGEPFVPFDRISDYDQYVDGKPREDGTRSFLASRGIELPEGSPDDKPGTRTVHGLGNWKNQIVLRKIKEDGVNAFPGSVSYVHAAARAGLARAVVSSSTNCKDILAAAGLADQFDVVVDGVVAAREKLHGKPAPDTYLAGARELAVEPARASVFEDALAGVAAGRAGAFGWVVGVDRVGQASALREHGADVVVTDLSQLLTAS